MGCLDGFGRPRFTSFSFESELFWRAIYEPLIIAAVRYVETFEVAHFDGLSCAAFEPFPDFGMAIGEGEAARAVVVARGQIAPMRAAAGGQRIIEECAIIDAVWMFIDGHPHERGGRMH